MGGDDKKTIRSVRIWQNIDVEAVRKQLILVDDLYGSCGNCKQLGLNYLKDRKCTSCGNEFRYLATKLQAPGEVAKILNRIHKEELPLQVIDRDDFERASARDALQDLFS